MMAEKLYFAYGSNINLDQMAFRCPEAVPVGPVMLENYELLFRGNNRMDGVATIRPKKGSYVYGLMWKITPECEKSLDRYEGWPVLYQKQQVSVFNKDGQKVSAMVYVMDERGRNPSVPWESYYNGIRDGYLQNNLPVKHLERALEQVHHEVYAMQPLRKSSRKAKNVGKEAR